MKRASRATVLLALAVLAATGIGIDGKHAEALFESFAQADGSTTRRYGGTGLGLAISRQLVELMGGEIGVKSELGKGSTFWLEVTIATAMTGAAPPEPDAEPETVAPAGDGASILLAEDNPTNQAVAINILRRRGYRVDVASHGGDAVDALRRETYAAVLMDCQMPVLDGYAATAEIRRLEGSARRTPIIAMTAHAMEGDRERCLAAGMDDYLSKPLDGPALDAVLQRWIAADATVMDRSVLRALARDVGDEAIVQEICDLFITETGPRVREIERAALDRDADVLRVSAHTLNGSASNVGAIAVAGAAAELERLARAGELDALGAPLLRLTDAVELTRAALGRTAA